MTTLSGNEMLIAAGISIFSIIISVFLIRMVANILLLLAFAAAVVAPIVWYSHEKASGSEMPVLGLYVAAVVFAGFSVVSAAIFHADFSNQNQMIHFMKNVSIAGGFLFLIVHGAGTYSLDSRKNAHRR